MLILDIMSTCNSLSLATVLVIIKKIIFYIQIMVPILLIVASSIETYRLVLNPDKKDGVKKIINKFIAAIFIFMLPIIINALMAILGERATFSDCYNKAENTVKQPTIIRDINKQNRVKIITD